MNDVLTRAAAPEQAATAEQQQQQETQQTVLGQPTTNELTMECPPDVVGGDVVNISDPRTGQPLKLVLPADVTPGESFQVRLIVPFKMPTVVGVPVVPGSSPRNAAAAADSADWPEAEPARRAITAPARLAGSFDPGDPPPRDNRNSMADDGLRAAG